MLNYVADNYRRNGFRIAVKVATPSQVPSVLGHAAVEAVRISTLQGASPNDVAQAFGQVPGCLMVLRLRARHNPEITKNSACSSCIAQLMAERETLFQQRHRASIIAQPALDHTKVVECPNHNVWLP